MAQEVDLIESEIPPLIERLMAASSLFHGIERDALAELLRDAGRRVRLAPGEDLVVEGEPADALYFVESGRFEVRKRGTQGGETHRIGETRAGAVVGEVALLDRGTRSATVRALADSEVLQLRIGALQAGAGEMLHPATQMRLNLAHEMARRVRDSTESTVRHLEQSLLEAETRAEMGRFMSRVLTGTCLYMFALALMQPLKGVVADSTVISAAILLCFAGALFVNIRTSMFPVSAYGFTLQGWRPAVREAVLFSLPVLGLIVLLKWMLIQTLPALSGEPLFGWYRHTGLGTGATLAVAVAYGLFVPLQEMVARSGIQSSFMMFLRARRKVAMSIFMSTLLFSATHLHTSATFAALAFPVGLFWGWLYSRHPTLVGVILSHLVIGVWAIFVVSFPIF
jgi:CRP-like cAMP-binding protein/membrane protease YdiL (CAAX protease family)